MNIAAAELCEVKHGLLTYDDYVYLKVSAAQIHIPTKAELVQVNHTPIICLENVTNKKVGNRKN